MTFEQFMKRADAAIGKVADGLRHNDFADALWYDLFEATAGEASDDEICETLAEQDSIFEQWLEFHHNGE